MEQFWIINMGRNSLAWEVLVYNNLIELVYNFIKLFHIGFYLVFNVIK